MACASATLKLRTNERTTVPDSHFALLGSLLIPVSTRRIWNLHYSPHGFSPVRPLTPATRSPPTSTTLLRAPWFNVLSSTSIFSHQRKKGPNVPFRNHIKSIFKKYNSCLVHLLPPPHRARAAPRSASENSEMPPPSFCPSAQPALGHSGHQHWRPPRHSLRRERQALRWNVIITDKFTEVPPPNSLQTRFFNELS